MSKVLQGRYRLGKELGRGGCGVVYQGEWLMPGDQVRPIAIKSLLPPWHDKTDARAQLLREAEYGMQVANGHHGFPAVYDVFEEDGFLYIVTDLVHGVSLRGIIEGSFLLSNSRIPVRAVRTILRCCADALRHCHEQQVLHRDVSPANIMVSVDGAVQLIDLGLATLVEGAGVISRAWGTLAYASYEQISDEKMDFSSDLYSLASCAYHALYGAPPFGTHRGDILDRMAADTPPPLQGLPDDLTAILTGLLARRPLRAISSADEILAALDPDVASPGELADITKTILGGTRAAKDSRRSPEQRAAGGAGTSAQNALSAPVHAPTSPRAPSSGPGRGNDARDAHGHAEGIVPSDAPSEALTLDRARQPTQERALTSRTRIRDEARRAIFEHDRRQAERLEQPAQHRRTGPKGPTWRGWLRRRQGLVMFSAAALTVALLLGRYAAHRDHGPERQAHTRPSVEAVPPGPPVQLADSPHVAVVASPATPTEPEPSQAPVVHTSHTATVEGHRRPQRSRPVTGFMFSHQRRTHLFD